MGLQTALTPPPELSPEQRECCQWIEDHHLIVGPDGQPAHIHLTPHQKAILRYVFTPGPDGRFRYTTVVWSCPKKSGKTAISAAVGRWAAETWGPYQEIYCLANDFDQARSRCFQAISQSIEMDPAYNTRRRIVPGQWAVQDRVLENLVTGSKVRALASDYKGEAGSNPSLTIFTELWGYVHEASKRLWTEMTPSPARPVSMRWVETYAGFEGESELLEDLYKLGKAGRQLTAGEIGDLSAFVEAPNWDSLVPIWVNESAGLCMYWDEGPLAHRMPWQQGEEGDRYYREQAATLTPQEYERLHNNAWSSGSLEGIPIEWWDAGTDAMPLGAGEVVSLVVAVDASVSGDCTALNVVSRHPHQPGHVIQRFCKTWAPPAGGKMDYRETITPVVDWLCQNYNVVQVAFDPYQLHHWATEQRDKLPATWYREFDQGTDRLLADKQLYDLIRDRKIHHLGDPEQRQHLLNVALKVPGGEANKLRFVKKGESRKIDLTVSLSMAVAECLRLNI